MYVFKVSKINIFPFTYSIFQILLIFSLNVKDNSERIKIKIIITFQLYKCITLVFVICQVLLKWYRHIESPFRFCG